MIRRFLDWLFRPAGRRTGYRRRGRRRTGCLIWLLILLAILVVLSLFFGSFQKGTKASGPLARPARAVAQLAVTG